VSYVYCYFHFIEGKNVKKGLVKNGKFYVSCSRCNKPAVITNNKHSYCLDHCSDRKTLKAASEKNNEDRNSR
jgi:hypothetical protein